MSIRKRLVLSNIGMVIIPLISFVLLEMIIGNLLLMIQKGNIGPETKELFLSIRPFLFLGVLILSNVFLTLIVSKSIIRPLLQLKNAAIEISEGNLDVRINLSSENNELNEFAKAFENMRQKLKEAKNLQRQYEMNQKEFIANISHDLKTPLTSVKGYIKGIADGVANTPEKMERYIKIVEKKAENMEYMIAELLLFSKLDLPNVPYELKQIDLATYYKDYIEELQFMLSKENIDISFDYDKKESYVVSVDLEKLSRVVSNIIQNSIKYMKQDYKKITIKLNSKENEVLVVMTDNGIGVPKEELPLLFDRFYRTDSSRNSTTGGSGLGLAIVKKIIEGHGGTVWARGDAGKGLSIFFTLPKRKENDFLESDFNR